MIQHFPRNFSWFLNEVFPALGTPLQNAFANGGVSIVYYYPYRAFVVQNKIVYSTRFVTRRAIIL